MSKKKYLAPQISIIMFEPQAILAGSGPATGSITYDSKIKEGEESDWDNYHLN